MRVNKNVGMGRRMFNSCKLYSGWIAYCVVDVRHEGSENRIVQPC